MESLPRVAPKVPKTETPVANVFGTNATADVAERTGMSGAESILAETDAPSTTEHELLDVRDLPPPEPLKRTLETLAELDGGVLLQVNDRVPQHLFPRLDERGFAYDAVEREDGVVTAIWAE
jgi:uncharacterized protein (DUF2249 family)